jgi:DNA-binding NarL/FixJ family response regulator
VNEKKNSRGSIAAKTKILVIDDHPVVCDGLTMFLNCQADMKVVACAGNAADAVKSIEKNTIDVAIVDMLLKDTTGVHITEQLRAICPRLIVLIFSMSDEMHHIQRAFEAGARGYVTKDEPSENIIYAIRQIIQGKTYLSKRLSALFTRHQLRKFLV